MENPNGYEDGEAAEANALAETAERPVESPFSFYFSEKRAPYRSVIPIHHNRSLLYSE
jgi:hypothetical protein